MYDVGFCVLYSLQSILCVVQCTLLYTFVLPFIEIEKELFFCYCHMLVYIYMYNNVMMMKI